MAKHKDKGRCKELGTIQRHVKYSIGNIVHNIIITTDGVRWVIELLGDPFVRGTNV